ncbi:phosphatase PAP2 family protein [Oxalicibacterium faecigallinarum]|uniref:Phosphoesterase n=1 Tax=Oxalicibacterium faecigallinarum TaxID=573741 RepID=A0A8J3AVD3_9BURK|nr:phosphatase PAP2 family protein [Oxalicibacterium faecigallinarum]GGI17276.1 phosphoesterase [Oxalicibacterium faecigallinarum]
MSRDHAMRAHAGFTLPALSDDTSAPHDEHRFILWNIAILLISALLLTMLSRDGKIDFALADLFFDHKGDEFPLRDLPILATYGHTWLKNLTTLFWLACMPLAIASFWYRPLYQWRSILFKFVIFAGCTAYVVQSLKSGSPHACPWDVTQFGGQAHWFPLFDMTGATSTDGRCWPGGHASGGFALVAIYFAARTTRPTLALSGLLLGLYLGCLMGLIQMMRGAHFLSHNLWSLWIVWAVCFALDRVWSAIAQRALGHHK